jgi:hypothetical protein
MQISQVITNNQASLALHHVPPDLIQELRPFGVYLDIMLVFLDSSQNLTGVA